MRSASDSLLQARPRDLADKILALWMTFELHNIYAEMGSEGQEARDCLEELVRRAEAAE